VLGDMLLIGKEREVEDACREVDLKPWSTHSPTAYPVSVERRIEAWASVNYSKDWRR
jgi:hypothetical protein